MGLGGVAIAILPSIICLKLTFSDGLGGSVGQVGRVRQVRQVRRIRWKNTLFNPFKSYLHDFF